MFAMPSVIRTSLRLSAFTLVVGLLPWVLTGCEEDASVMKPAVSKLVQDAQEATQSGNMGLARCRLESALSLSPGNYTVAYNLGVVETTEMHWPEAAAAYQQALEKKPNSPDALYGLALAQKELALSLRARMNGKPNAELAAHADEALNACIQSSDAFLQVAPESDQGRELVAEAKQACESALSQAPGNVQ